MGRAKVGLLLIAVICFLSLSRAEGVVRPDREVGSSEAGWNAVIGYNLDLDESEEVICTGALISSRVVLTAAHCFLDIPEDEMEGLEVGVGLRDFELHDGVLYKPVAVVYHGKYKRAMSYDIFGYDGEIIESVVGDVREGENDYDSDIAVVLLNKDVKGIKPVRLPFSKSYKPRSNWRVYGWGVTGENEDIFPRKLLTAKQEDFTDKYNKEKGVILENVYAAYSVTENGASGTCWGDSGGPLIDGKGVLIGITSFSEADTCSALMPTFFTSVASNLDWIKYASSVAKGYGSVYLRNDVISPGLSYIVGLELPPLIAKPVA